MRLPEKLSDCIDVALNDLESVEKDPRYVINMLVWHTGKASHKSDDVCHVCLAGAVIARSLKSNISEYTVPDYFDSYTSNRLNALNFVRAGSLSSAIYLIGKSTIFIGYMDLVRKYQKIPNYDLYPDDFKSTLKNLALDLRAKGL